jgi:predicted porin
MKKSLVTLAAMALASAVSAQSSVTLFGVVDASVSGFSNKATNVLGQSITTKQTVLRNSAYNASRLGFRGTEDLGNGLAASFWLEAPITNDDGQQGVSTFARRSTVSLSGGFGEIRLGRDYTPTFWNDTVFDPFGTNGVGTNLIFIANNSFGAFNGPAATPVLGITNVTGNNTTRASNTIGYFLPPNLGGFYGQVMYGFSEQVKYDSGRFTPAGTNNARAGRYVGGRFGYGNGPLDVALSYGSSTIGDDYYGGTTTKVNTLNFGASYDLGPVKLFGELSKAKNKIDYEVTPLAGARPDIDLTGYLLGVTVPVGSGLIRAAWSQVRFDRNLPFNPFVLSPPDQKATKLALGYVHNLSKRTALYATIARVSDKNGANPSVGGPGFISNPAFTPKTSTGYDVGIRHAF